MKATLWEAGHGVGSLGCFYAYNLYKNTIAKKIYHASHADFWKLQFNQACGIMFILHTNKTK